MIVRTEPPREPAILLDGVAKTYGSGAAAVPALRGIDLMIAAGEFVVVLGPSGSGKTTLLNVVGGIDSSTAGRVVVAGEDISRYGADRLTDYRRRHVGFVFQFFNLLPALTARENVEVIAELTGAASAPGADLLRAVGLGARLDHFPGALSGGEQQRVAIARALVKAPPLLLCDEPTGALDLETGRQVLTLLRQVSRDRGQTVLLVTHNAAIAGMADRVLRMRSGTIVADECVASPRAPSSLEW
ncbi:MAG TPA: ABC transporter ATP-binding protein [Thermomicrobiales bacterium]